MSLQVWLPLNGDLKNNGLQQLTLTETDITINNDGKIGKCYEFNGSSSQITAPTINIPNNSWSISAWVYPIKDSSSAYQYLVSCHNSGSGDFKFSLCFYKNKFQARIHGNSAGDTSTTPTIDLGKWYHACITYSSGITKIYVNGIKVYSTTTLSVQDEVSKFIIGARYGSAGYFQGRMNDIRVYNHCLSDKEVEEISKGLIAHYMLNTPQKNLLENTMVKTPTTYAAGSIPLKEKLIPNKKYTLQLWDLDISNSATSESTIGFGLQWYDNNHPLFKVLGSSNFDSGSTGTNVHKDYLKYTFTTPSSSPSIPEGTADQLKFYNSPKASGDGIAASGTLNFNIGRWKLEKGEIATSFEENIIYDCSGYRNNGIAYNVIGVFPSPKYNTATNFNGAGYINNISNIIEQDSLNSEFTFSAWIKRNYTTENIKYIYNGIISISLSTAFKPSFQWHMQNEDGSYSQINGWGPGTENGVIPKDIWTHFVFTFRRGVLSFYYNGILIGSTDRSANGIYIKGYLNKNLGATSNSSNIFSNYFIGDISDVRIYMTALSDDQIKDLYNTSMAIDSDGNVYARELIE